MEPRRTGYSFDRRTDCPGGGHTFLAAHSQAALVAEGNCRCPHCERILKVRRHLANPGWHMVPRHNLPKVTT